MDADPGIRACIISLGTLWAGGSITSMTARNSQSKEIVVIKSNKIDALTALKIMKTPNVSPQFGV